MLLTGRCLRYLAIVAYTIHFMSAATIATEFEFFTDGAVINGQTFQDLLRDHRSARIAQIEEREIDVNKGGHVYYGVDPVIRPEGTWGYSDSIVPADTWIFQGLLAAYDYDSRHECKEKELDSGWEPLENAIKRIDQRMTGRTRDVWFDAEELERDLYVEGRIETMHTVVYPPDTPAGPCFFPDGVNPVERIAATAGHFILIPPLEPGPHTLVHFEDGNDLRFRNYFVLDGLIGDLDRSGALDVADIDMISAAVRDDSVDLLFDRDRNGIVNSDDRTYLIKDSFNTYFGDANLDGEFNSSDFVRVFEAAKFAVDIDASWGDGDWNGDNRFNSIDFVTAFQDGGYEQGLRAAAVPEPSSLLLLTLGLSLTGLGRNRKR